MQTKTKKELEQLVAATVAGDRRALAKVISLIENQDAECAQLLSLLFPHTGNLYVIGLTGAPGVGKSTLVDKLVLEISRRGKKVAVLAVDPSSPFSGGAILGDRIRMYECLRQTDVFVRSMASRGALGGLAPRSQDALLAFDAAGFDYLIIETVGVGQAEVEIMRTADTVAVVLIPGMGDSVQALKAGLLEIADVFVINKADYPELSRLEKELHSLIHLNKAEQPQAEIVKTIASESKGIEELIDALFRHQTSAQQSGLRERRRRDALLSSIKRKIVSAFEGRLEGYLSAQENLGKALELIAERKSEPEKLVQQILKALLKSKS